MTENGSAREDLEMETYTIKNGNLSATIAAKGAELISFKKGDREYMWDADPAFWGRTSPVLFPVVGSLKNKQFTDGGEVYPMGQHGFARDTEFQLICLNDISACFRLKWNEDTLKIFPYKFMLDITYRLTQNSLKVTWNVINQDTKKNLHFSIGAHPAFLCAQEGYAFKIYDASNLSYKKLNSDGTLNPKAYDLQLSGGILPITQALFAEDALIFEDSNVKRIALLDKDEKEYLSVEFEAPLFGLWSPAGKNAPFVCIEPWYGRCDSQDFAGEWKDREYSNHLEGGECFTASYSILV